MHYTATFRKRLSPQGSRPALLSEAAGWQTRVLLHDVGHLPVPALDVPVPQMVDQLPDIEQFFRVLSPDPEQVIEVPKILPFDVPVRTAVRVTAAGGSAGGSADDHILFLVTADCGAATSTFQFLVVVEDQVLVFKVFPLDSVQQRRLPPRNAFSERIVEQIVDRVSSGRLHGSLPGPGSSSSHSPSGVEERADEPGKGGKGFFSHFSPTYKKCEVGLHTRGHGSAPRVEPIHAGGRAQLARIFSRVGAAQGTQC